MSAGTPLFDPARLPRRSAEGYTYHPDLEQFDTSTLDDEGGIDLAKLREAGYEFDYVELEDDLEEQHPAFLSYFERADGVSEWDPSVPDGYTSANLVAIFDAAENGPVAIYVRPAGQGGAA